MRENYYDDRVENDTFLYYMNKGISEDVPLLTVCFFRVMVFLRSRMEVYMFWKRFWEIFVTILLVLAVSGCTVDLTSSESEDQKNKEPIPWPPSHPDGGAEVLIFGEGESVLDFTLIGCQGLDY